jgi:DNA-binding transcriptional MerR regulator
MFKIGDFSKLARVPVKTLRYYDEEGLLAPARVDRFTEYRYYTAEQLVRLNRILALKDLGLSLAQIKLVLQNALSVEQLRGMLALRRAEIADQLETTRAQMDRVEARVKLMELEENMSNFDAIIKNIEPMWVASVGTTVPNYENLGPVFDRLFGALFGYVMRVAAPAGPGVALYRDDGSMQNVPVEALCPLAGPIAATDQVKVYQLEGGTMASTLHRGPYDNLSATYGALSKWIEANGYRPAGYPREVYLSMDRDKPETWVTEIQFPVVKG